LLLWLQLWLLLRQLRVRLPHLSMGWLLQMWWLLPVQLIRLR
jgi:hypothetical protein